MTHAQKPPFRTRTTIIDIWCFFDFVCVKCFGPDKIDKISSPYLYLMGPKNFLNKIEAEKSGIPHSMSIRVSTLYKTCSLGPVLLISSRHSFSEAERLLLNAFRDFP